MREGRAILSRAAHQLIQPIFAFASFCFDGLKIHCDAYHVAGNKGAGSGPA
jgi:hypothetical protein